MKCVVCGKPLPEPCRPTTEVCSLPCWWRRRGLAPAPAQMKQQAIMEEPFDLDPFQFLGMCADERTSGPRVAFDLSAWDDTALRDAMIATW